MRVYNRAMGGTSWNTLEEYVETPTVRWYGTSAACGQDYDWLAGHWLSGCAPPPEGTMLYQDTFGLGVSKLETMMPYPEHLQSVVDLPHPQFAVALAAIPALFVLYRVVLQAFVRQPLRPPSIGVGCIHTEAWGSLANSSPTLTTPDPNPSFRQRPEHRLQSSANPEFRPDPR
ncbi:MAG: hypothetical protein KatS3mg017_0022 [Fimbriimonadales bacterium]|nr:MAG: hypothetical protein KatS3mg017_0022 [Fimbriimonadales bacterium]